MGIGQIHIFVEEGGGSAVGEIDAGSGNPVRAYKQRTAGILVADRLMIGVERKSGGANSQLFCQTSHFTQLFLEFCGLSRFSFCEQTERSAVLGSDDVALFEIDLIDAQ